MVRRMPSTHKMLHNSPYHRLLCCVLGPGHTRQIDRVEGVVAVRSPAQLGGIPGLAASRTAAHFSSSPVCTLPALSPLTKSCLMRLLGREA
jgi:hypothetical protein